MLSLAEKVYMDLMARGKDIETARCWRRWYPPREMLVKLARMSKAECEEHTWFGLYLWEKKHLVGKYHIGKSVLKV